MNNNLAVPNTGVDTKRSEPKPIVLFCGKPFFDAFNNLIDEEIKSGRVKLVDYKK
tara:strand:- start:38 stop:202 length:165 start_codon:yes stop_codon:yes gene_type:complete